MKILFVTSPGGHLAQLLSLRSWWENYSHEWVTFKQSEVESTLAGERITWAHFPTTRNARNAIKNFWLAWPTLRRVRPDVVVSNGAGVSVPFFLVCKIMRIRTVYIECFDRITLPTLSGRICYPLSDLFCIQWEEQSEFYPGSVNIGHLL
jgi:UDP-N-acetylglucosamine:LPS N-acetylglucosamine transferase